MIKIHGVEECNRVIHVKKEVILQETIKLLNATQRIGTNYFLVHQNGMPEIWEEDDDSRCPDKFVRVADENELEILSLTRRLKELLR